METDIKIFRHDYPIRVRTFHVDRQNVVHNIWYFYFLEEARVEYFRDLGMPIDDQTFITHHKFFVVRNTCDYLMPAVFDDEIIVKTRTAYVKNSSMGLEHVVVAKHSGRVLVRATHVLVYVDTVSNRPERLSSLLRDKIKFFEQGNAEFIDEN